MCFKQTLAQHTICFHEHPENPFDVVGIIPESIGLVYIFEGEGDAKILLLEVHDGWLFVLNLVCRQTWIVLSDQMAELYCRH